MDLFNDEAISNALPYDGTANYYGKILSHEQANLYFAELVNTIEWKNDEAPTTKVKRPRINLTFRTIIAYLRSATLLTT